MTKQKGYLTCPSTKIFCTLSTFQSNIVQCEKLKNIYFKYISLFHFHLSKDSVLLFCTGDFLTQVSTST